MKQSPFVWIDGNIISSSQAYVPLLTHTLHYGDGVYEGIAVYKTNHGPAIFRLKEHVNRLYDSFSIFHKEIPYEKPVLADAIIETVKVNRLSHGYIRPLVYIGDQAMKLDINSMPVHVAIAVWEWDKHLGNKPVRAMISSFMRIHKRSLFVDKKITGHYVNSILAHQEAKEKGYDEALLLDHEGAIAEGSGANFFVVRDECVQTPQAGSILPGITRDSVLKIAHRLNIPTKEVLLYPHDLAQATEAFFTGTATEISPIKAIDNYKFDSDNPESTTQRIKRQFELITTGSTDMFNEWLTLV